MNTAQILKAKHSHGFTLIELLIVLAIMAVITTVIVFNQRSYADIIALQSSQNDINLQIRQAQVYGVSVREFAPGTDEFGDAYGVSFSYLTNNTYYAFADRGTHDGYFDYDSPTPCIPGGTSECLSQLYITKNNILSNICVIKSDNTTACSPGVSRVDVTFLRPDPYARIIFFNSSGVQINSSYPNFKGFKIELTSPQKAKRYIYVYTTGQISLSNT